MKSLFTISLFLALPLLVFSQDSCKQFVTGNFTVKDKPYIKIKRTCKYQYETNTREKIKSTYKIEWLDECIYRLTMIKTTGKVKELIGVPMVHKIIRSESGDYTYTTAYTYIGRDRCGAIGRHVKKEETIIKND